VVVVVAIVVEEEHSRQEQERIYARLYRAYRAKRAQSEPWHGPSRLPRSRGPPATVSVVLSWAIRRQVSSACVPTHMCVYVCVVCARACARDRPPARAYVFMFPLAGGYVYRH